MAVSRTTTEPTTELSIEDVELPVDLPIEQEIKSRLLHSISLFNLAMYFLFDLTFRFSLLESFVTLCGAFSHLFKVKG